MKSKKIVWILIFFIIFIIWVYVFYNRTVNININLWTDIKKYNDAQSINDYIEIKNNYILSKNAIDILISYCNFYEYPNEYNYIIEEWKKVKINRDLLSNIIESIKIDLNLNEKESENYIDDFNNLLKNWEVKWYFLLFKNFNNKISPDLSKFNNDVTLFLDVYWNYMFSLKDDSIFDEYSKNYINFLNNIKIISNKQTSKQSENYILPLLNAHIYHYWKCKNFIEDNFISY